MFKKFSKLSGLISIVLMAGLLITGVTALAGNNYGKSNENQGLLEDTFLSNLAEKVGVEPESLASMMDEAMSQANLGDERPMADSYLQTLASDLGLEADELKSLMVTTKVEAIDELLSEGKISEELEASMKERAQTFPFGYAYQGSKTGSGTNTRGSGSGQSFGPSDGSGERLQSQDGSGYGSGSGKGGSGQGICDGEGPKGNADSDDRGNRGPGGRGNRRN